MLGGAVGVVSHRILPFAMAAPGAYALVGMGALFAGVIRAPMTSVFMVFEITQDYEILVRSWSQISSATSSRGACSTCRCITRCLPRTVCISPAGFAPSPSGTDRGARGDGVRRRMTPLRLFNLAAT